MNSIRRVICLCSLTAILACGCNFFFNPCADVTCDAGEVCVNGACVRECDTTADCGAGEVCTNGNCVAAGECDSDDDCDAGEVCAEATNTCVECEAAADCDDDDACTTDSCASNVCLNTAIACVTVATCPAGCDVACTSGFCTD